VVRGKRRVVGARWGIVCGVMDDNDGQPVFKAIGAHPDEIDDNVFLSQSRFRPSWRACRYCGVS
jgi:hypothetical protein